MPNAARVDPLPGSYEYAAKRFREKFGDETCQCPNKSCHTKVKHRDTIWLGDSKGNYFNPECVLENPDLYPQAWVTIAKEKH